MATLASREPSSKRHSPNPCTLEELQRRARWPFSAVVRPPKREQRCPGSFEPAYAEGSELGAESTAVETPKPSQPVVEFDRQIADRGQPSKAVRMNGGGQ